LQRWHWSLLDGLLVIIVWLQLSGDIEVTGVSGQLDNAGCRVGAAQLEQIVELAFLQRTYIHNVGFQHIHTLQKVD
jgi:hypothetical protein